MNLKEKIRTIPDFPEPGIQFKDIESITEDPQAFAYVISEFESAMRGREINKIVALDARGFLFGAALGHTQSLPVIMARKKGKLGGERLEQSYALEYGEATIELQKTAIQQGDRVVIVDDLLATGGTAAAAADLVRRMGAKVHLFAFVIELPALAGRAKLGNRDIVSLVSY